WWPLESISKRGLKEIISPWKTRVPTRLRGRTMSKSLLRATPTKLKRREFTKVKTNSLLKRLSVIARITGVSSAANKGMRTALVPKRTTAKILLELPWLKSKRRRLTKLTTKDLLYALLGER
ncbi:hypothetical protein, partial [Enterobacter cloacae complex sp. 2DZ2F20B]|uniref:hypothetical protein n=1 Tax=Enterobacter cloacae complex sp. 2DZ2F20B TaxID=2511993 RepID=UPI001CA5408B